MRFLITLVLTIYYIAAFTQGIELHDDKIILPNQSIINVPTVPGTIVFDEQRDRLAIRMNNKWMNLNDVPSTNRLIVGHTSFVPSFPNIELTHTNKSLFVDRPGLSNAAVGIKASFSLPVGAVIDSVAMIVIDKHLLTNMKLLISRMRYDATSLSVQQTLVEEITSTGTSVDWRCFGAPISNEVVEETDEYLLIMSAIDPTTTPPGTEWITQDLEFNRVIVYYTN